ncbi:MAG: DUF4386 domain-containing protein [Anaerolineae bacterium]
MDTKKKVARSVGALFLIAMVTSLAGGMWLESMLAAPDYLDTLATNETQVLIGVLLELINCIAVVGIAVFFFPILRDHGETLALGYLGFRLVEVVILIAAVISPLVLVALSREYAVAGAAEAAHFQTLGTVLIAARAQMAGLLVPIFFGLGAFLLYYSLYQTKIVPRFISVWGLLAVVLMVARNLLAAFGVTISADMVLVLPIILNEILLGIWLMAKGFNAPSAASRPARAALDVTG